MYFDCIFSILFVDFSWKRKAGLSCNLEKLHQPLWRERERGGEEEREGEGEGEGERGRGRERERKGEREGEGEGRGGEGEGRKGERVIRVYCSKQLEHSLSTHYYHTN